jgi:hypothetical protein
MGRTVRYRGVVKNLFAAFLQAMAFNLKRFLVLEAFRLWPNQEQKPEMHTKRSRLYLHLRISKTENLDNRLFGVLHPIFNSPIVVAWSFMLTNDVFEGVQARCEFGMDGQFLAHKWTLDKKPFCQ